LILYYIKVLRTMFPGIISNASKPLNLLINLAKP
jgi:hypothetical protein